MAERRQYKKNNKCAEAQRRRNSPLTWELVTAIRELAANGMKPAAIKQTLGLTVHISTIKRIIYNKRWATNKE